MPTRQATAFFGSLNAKRMGTTAFAEQKAYWRLLMDFKLSHDVVYTCAKCDNRRADVGPQSHQLLQFTFHHQPPQNDG